MNPISPSFTLEQCEKLIKHYSPLIIGKEVEEGVAIESLIIKTFDNGENSVYCQGERTKLFNFSKDLCLVALRLNLIHPNELLQSQNQSSIDIL